MRQQKGSISGDIKTEVLRLLQSPQNPLTKYANMNLIRYPNLFQESELKAALNSSLPTPEYLLFLIKKRVEFIFDKFPNLTDENKRAQKALSQPLNDFCKVYNLEMIEIPSD